MNNLYQLIVFDWEGTLSDPYGAILSVIAKSAEQLGHPVFDKTIAYQKMELGLAMVLKQLYPDLNPHDQENLFSMIQQEIMHHSNDVCLIPGAFETVKALYEQNIITAVATNRGQNSLQRALQISGLDAYIKLTRCAGQCASKPAPDMLQELMWESQIPSANTIMIGDSVSDITMATACHVPAIGFDVTYQLKSELEAAGATTVLHNYNELNAYLNLS